MASLKSILPKYLETSRLVLECFDSSPAHYACILGSINTPTAHKDMGDFGINTVEALDNLFSGTKLQASIFATPVKVDTNFYYVMRLGDKDGPMMGGISLAQRGANIPPDMGWSTFEEYHGKGYTTEAAKEVLRFLTQDLGVKDIIVWPGATNTKSINVAKRVGFVEGSKVRDEHGEEVMVYVLPGMTFDNSITLRLHGER